MACLLLLSTTGFSMNVHYCQDQLKGISLIGKAKSCHETQEASPCHKVKKACHHKSDNLTQAEKDNCCHNESIVIEKSEVDATSPQLGVEQDIQLSFVAAFVAVYVLDYHVASDYQQYQQYKPPLPDRDRQVLYQSFLI